MHVAHNFDLITVSHKVIPANKQVFKHSMFLPQASIVKEHPNSKTLG